MTRTHNVKALYKIIIIINVQIFGEIPFVKPQNDI